MLPDLVPSSYPAQARATWGNELSTRSLSWGPDWFFLDPVLWLHQPLIHGHTECLRALHVGAPNTVDRGRELSPVPLESLVNSISVSTHQERKRNWELAYLSHSIGGKNRGLERDSDLPKAPQRTSGAELHLGL